MSGGRFQDIRQVVSTDRLGSKAPVRRSGLVGASRPEPVNTAPLQDFRNRTVGRPVWKSLYSMRRDVGAGPANSLWSNRGHATKDPGINYEGGGEMCRLM
jgi:hypothetical protein